MYDFLKFDESDVLEGAVEAYENATNTTLYAGDERRILLNSFMYVAKIMIEKANYLANQYCVQTANEEFLLKHGEGRGVIRLQAEKALVNVSFSVATVMQTNVVIPTGTRVTADGTVYFATMQEATILAGNTSVTIPCEATVPGIRGNDYAIGTINVLVDNVVYVSSVSNIDVSDGGSEEESIEDYRNRVLLKPYSYSTAGPEDGYIYLTKSAESTVGSVTVDTLDSTVTITVLNKDGSIPSDLVISRISEALDKKTVRPVTDKVVVQKPTPVEYYIYFKYKIAESDSALVETIKANVSKAVNNFINRQKILGRSVNPDELRKDVLNAGAYTVEIINPSFMQIAKNEVAVLDGQTIIYDGLYGGA